MSVFLQIISPVRKPLDEGLITECLHTVTPGQYVIKTVGLYIPTESRTDEQLILF